jgi:hypothetical protein
MPRNSKSVRNLIGKCALKVVRVAGLLLLTNGCTPDLFYSPGVWNLDVVSANDSSHPIFCISAEPRCGGSRYYEHELEVYRVGSEPWPERNVWTIEQDDGRPIETFTYGVAPSGWKTTKGPLPLEEGKFYQVRNVYFRCSGQAPDGSCTVFTKEQFRESHLEKQH